MFAKVFIFAAVVAGAYSACLPAPILGAACAPALQAVSAYPGVLGGCGAGYLGGAALPGAYAGYGLGAALPGAYAGYGCGAALPGAYAGYGLGAALPAYAGYGCGAPLPIC